MPVVKRALEYAERLQRAERWQKTTHTFSSSLPLQVYTVLPNARAQLAGETPGTVAFDLQADEAWFVYCLPAVQPSQIPTLVADADRDGVPRLMVHSAKSLDPVALSQLSGIGSLRGLSMPPDQASLAGLGQVTQLRELDVTNNTLLDSDELSHVTPLANLERLILTASPGIGDGAAAHLAPLTQLRSLYLNRTGIGDAGLTAMLQGGLPALRGLHLDRCAVSDAIVPELLARPALEHLDLIGTALSDAGLEQLTPLTQLSALAIGGESDLMGEAPVLALTGACSGLLYFRALSANVGDTALAHLGGLQALTELDLSYTLISDAGLPQLYDVLTLRTLFAMETQVTQAGAAQLESQIPGLEVVL